jgi:hypothetical protein
MSDFKKDIQKLAEDLDKKQLISQKISRLTGYPEKQILDKLSTLSLGDYLNLISSTKSSNIEHIKDILDIESTGNENSI